MKAEDRKKIELEYDKFFGEGYWESEYKKHIVAFTEQQAKAYSDHENKELKSQLLHKERFAKKDTAEAQQEIYQLVEDKKQLQKQVERLEGLVKMVVDCPYTIDIATIPKSGNLLLNQVVGVISIANQKRKKLEQALKQ